MPEDFEPKVGAIFDVRISEAHNYNLISEIIFKARVSKQKKGERLE
ncbi:MAG: hypothetical protein H0U50_02185 [Pyrinomonadaceae bacterium]|nr:hypothetical protein [Pyrinomonadaceae bacterium]